MKIIEEASSPCLSPQAKAPLASSAAAATATAVAAAAFDDGDSAAEQKQQQQQQLQKQRNSSNSRHYRRLAAVSVSSSWTSATVESLSRVSFGEESGDNDKRALGVVGQASALAAVALPRKVGESSRAGSGASSLTGESAQQQRRSQVGASQLLALMEGNL